MLAKKQQYHERNNPFLYYTIICKSIQLYPDIFSDPMEQIFKCLPNDK